MQQTFESPHIEVYIIFLHKYFMVFIVSKLVYYNRAIIFGILKFINE